MINRKKLTSTILTKLVLAAGVLVLVLSRAEVARAACDGWCCCDGWASCGTESRNAGNGCAYRCDNGSWGNPIWCDGQGNGQPQFNTEGMSTEQVNAAVDQSLQQAAAQLSQQSAADTAQHAQTNAAQRAAEAVRQLAIVESMRQLGQLTSEQAATAGQKVVNSASMYQSDAVKAQIAQAQTLVGSGNQQAQAIAAMGYEYNADPNAGAVGGSAYATALATGNWSGVLPANFTSATGGTVISGGSAEVRDMPLPYGTDQGSDPCAGLKNWESTDSSHAYCGGAGGLYSCSRIKINGECNQKCGTLVNASCASQMGRPELAGTQYGYLKVDLQQGIIDCQKKAVGEVELRACGELALADSYCNTDAKGAVCNSSFTLQFTCKTSGGQNGAICIDRDEFRNSEFGTNTGSAVTIYDSKKTMSGLTTSGSPISVLGVSLPKIGFYDDDGDPVFLSTNSLSPSALGKYGTGTAYYVNGGAGGLYTGGETRGQTIAGGKDTPCNPGIRQGMIYPPNDYAPGGQIITTQRGGDRGACGAAGDCPAQHQRVCTSAGVLSADCVKSDACAPEVTEGAKCNSAGISQQSNGEPSNGKFVGCANGRNCFCKDLTGNSVVTCIGDAGIDSCGAAGKPITPAPIVPATTTALAQSQETITTTTTTEEEDDDTPTAGCNQACGAGANDAICVGGSLSCLDGVCRSTQCPVSEQNEQCVCEQPPAPMCIDIFASNADPQLGDSVNFTCATVTNAVRYDFRYAFTQSSTNDNLTWTSLAPVSSTSNQSQDLAITQVGRYVVQCRPCAANDLCQIWESTADPIGGPELPPTSTESTEETEEATTSAETTEEATDSGILE